MYHALKEADSGADALLVASSEISPVLQSACDGDADLTALLPKASGLIDDLLMWPATALGSRRLARRGFVETWRLSNTATRLRLSRPIPEVQSVTLDGQPLGEGTYLVEHASARIVFDGAIPRSGQTVEVTYSGGWVPHESQTEGPKVPDALREAVIRSVRLLLDQQTNIEGLNIRKQNFGSGDLGSEDQEFLSARAVIRGEIAPLVEAYRWREI